MEKLFVQHFYKKFLFNKLISITLLGVYLPNLGTLVRMFIRIVM